MSSLFKFRFVIAWALALAFLVSGSAIAGAPGSGDGQHAAAAKKKKCKKGKKCKKKKKPAAPGPAGAAAPAGAPAPAPGDGGPSEQALFDVTALSGSFDATATRTDASCALTNETQWTATLGSGAEPATLEVFPDEQGPVYIFNTGDIPYVETGSGTATDTCNAPDPGPNGTATCTFQSTLPDEAVIHSYPDDSRDPLTLYWFFGYPHITYNPGPFPGTGDCTYGGPRPPEMPSTLQSPSLFVHPLNDGSNLGEPLGTSTISPSQLNGDTTLSFSGNNSGAFGNTTYNSSWQLSVSLHRR